MIDTNAFKKKAKRKVNIDELPDAALVRANALFQSGSLPFSRATLWRLVKAGKFPAPAKISRSITAWNLGDVRRWRADLFPVANPSDIHLGDRS